ncbi:N-acetylmuramoyl-L-alanine amidase family protein [Indiicoccus explosivorum]|uniref:N-acetylmuramoyl-L-alanine amidase family protein n=1 Tax=Indiicoccus explosivorum TaxID=1917864 RepID=UPI000B4337E3|nr:N-acetylmuramoyl-L-alanine amidase [Indiicoccus explosivorum]
MKIIVDAGHGPETRGKRSPDGTMREYHFNAGVAATLKKLLLQAGQTVIFTHQADRDVPLYERVRLANRMKGDVFVSIHANAFGTAFNSAGGIETYVYTRPLMESTLLADAIHSRLVSTAGLRDRGIKKADFAVLRETVMPAVLLECGFMTNRGELALLKSGSYRQRCADAIAAGLLSYGRKSGCC